MAPMNIIKQFISQSAVVNCITIALVIIASCANPVAPTGGPKDVDPPLIIRSVPENGSVNFDADEIHITFNEFIQIRGLHQQFLSSPPFLKVPETRLRGKTLTIKLTEELRENTTYTLFFGNAIADFNEGNPIQNFRYVFSTGPILDSMELKGKVLNALTHSPEKEVFVMLYDIYEDSIPLKKRPYYISRTNDKGEFSFTNLRDIPYKIFALRDVNANLIYDQPNEEIAFLPERVIPHAPPVTFTKSDTLRDLSMPALNGQLEEGAEAEQKEDEIEGNNQTDTLVIAGEQQELLLYLFQEIDSTQRITKAEFLHPNRLQLIFRYPARELQVNPIPPFDEKWSRVELSQKADTAWFWLLNPERDTLVLEVQASKLNTDTLRIPLARFHAYRQEKTAGISASFLEVRTNLPRTGPFHIYEPVLLTFSEPLQSIDTARIMLLEDSVQVRPAIDFLNETQRVLSVGYTWKDTTTYLLRIADSAFAGIYGSINDTLKYGFKTRGRSDYGNLKINLEHRFVQGQLIAELLDDKGRMLRQSIIPLDQAGFEFRFLLPGKYQVKLIHDENMNGKWDTGIYLDGRQPEAVYFFDKILDLRANWDLEETFTIQGSK